MTDEQKAAYVNAQAAVLNATIAGMQAANLERESHGHTLAYDEAAFQEAIDNSSCHHNTVLSLFDPGS